MSKQVMILHNLEEPCIRFDAGLFGDRIVMLPPEHADLVAEYQARGYHFYPTIYQQAGLDPDVPAERVQEWRSNNQ